MSVVGFDFGNQNCFVGIARQGGVEIITNDYSVRATPSCVSYGSNLRSVGTAAWQKLLTNFKNTIFSFKHLVGRVYNDPVVQRERASLPFKLVELDQNRVGIQVQHCGQVCVVSPEQVLATLLQKLRAIAQDFLQAGVTNCVLSVPSFWTDAQRRALLDACAIADIGCLKLLNDTTAVALAYGLYKQDLPAESEQPVIVIFIDVGQSCTQISACAFNKGKLKMLGVVFDDQLGGRDFDHVLYNHFADQFLSKYKVDARSSPKATLRLYQECEKLKKQMTADPNNIPLSIDCFMEDKDVTGMMNRNDFENLAATLFDKFEQLLSRVLVETDLKADDVQSVELVGGGSRLPKFKGIVKRVLALDPRTTLNQDEAVARGCTLQSAMLSPAFRVREFGITDVQPYSIKLTWETSVEGDGETEVFPAGHAFPFSKVMTFFRTEPFALAASYSKPNCIPYSNYAIGKFAISNVVPSPEGAANKIKVKVRINPNGIFTVCTASMHEKLAQGPVIVEEQMETAPAEQTNNAEENDQDRPARGESEEGERAAEAKVQKPTEAAAAAVKSKVTDLPIVEAVFCMEKEQLERSKNMERDFERMDREEKEKTDAMNAVEEYVYEMRDKINDSLKPYIEEAEQVEFMQNLNATEEWLYDDSVDRDKTAYCDKLASLKAVGDPVVERYREAVDRPKAFEDLGRSLQIGRKAYEDYLAKEAKYDHWEQADADKLLKLIDEKQAWFDQSINMQNRRKLTEVPSVTVAQIVSARCAFERAAERILNKPKPEPPKVTEPPEKSKTTKADEAKQEQEVNNDSMETS